jgi:hypothetical protein
MQFGKKIVKKHANQYKFFFLRTLKVNILNFKFKIFFTLPILSIQKKNIHNIRTIALLAI